MDNDKAQVSVCPRCGTPSSPRGHGYTTAGYTCPPVDEAERLRVSLALAAGTQRAHVEEIVRLRAELTRVEREAREALVALGGQLAAAERERDALRGALVRLVTAEDAYQAATADEDDDGVRAFVALDVAWAHALDVLGRVTP